MGHFKFIFTQKNSVGNWELVWPTLVRQMSVSSRFSPFIGPAAIPSAYYCSSGASKELTESQFALTFSLPSLFYVDHDFLCGKIGSEL